MNLYHHFETVIAGAVAKLQDEGRIPGDCSLGALKVEEPRDREHGDLATNAAMVLAKPAGIKPRDLAEALRVHIEADPMVAAVTIAGPGFINLKLEEAFWGEVVGAVLDLGEAYGRCQIGLGKKVNVEYVSANPTGPLHVGHCRGAVFGDALASLLQVAGYDATREYYINDAGAQIDVLARSVELRYREALGDDIATIPEGLYPGEYLVPLGKALAEQHGRALLDLAESERIELIAEAAIAAMMDLVRSDLAALNIHHDVFFSERSLHGGNGAKIGDAIQELERRGFVYRGKLPPPKGQLPEDWEDREQTLLRSTEVGDDIDRPLVKSDGSYTYFAADVAYFRDKFERGFDQMIYVLGADHSGYIKRLEAVARAIAGDKARLIVRICQLVKLFRAGEPVKMSKRAGTFVTLADVVREVGSDAVRFMMLYRKNDAPLDFDFAKVTEQSRDNPVFYVQYAHARGYSIFRNAAETYPELTMDSDRLRKSDLSLLNDAGEIALIKRLAQYPRLIEAAAASHEPHRLAFYLFDLASEFHGHWNRGKDLPQLRFIREDDERLTEARLALVAATVRVISCGLTLLGVQAPREMR